MAFTGRRSLKADGPKPGVDVNDLAYIGEVLDQVLDDLVKNHKEVSDLYDFYKGDQPVLNRTDHPYYGEAHKIVENRAFEIVNFKVGYEFSHPTTFVNKGKAETEPALSEAIVSLNDFARLDNKEEKDVELSMWMYIAGHGFLSIRPNNSFDPEDGMEAPYKSLVLSPKEAFIIKENVTGGSTLYGGVLVKKKDPNDNDYWTLAMYTHNMYHEFTFKSIPTSGIIKSILNNPTSVNYKSEAHILGGVPIVEFKLNPARLGYVEVAYSLFNAINDIDSDQSDNISHTVNAIIALINAKIPEDNEGNKIPPELWGGMINVIGVEGLTPSIQVLTNKLDLSHTQLTKEDYLNAIYEICAVPDRKTRGNGGGDTGSAVVLRDGWGAAEAAAKTTEKMYRAAYMSVLKFILRIAKTQDIPVDTKLSDIGIQFTRTRTDNMNTRASTLTQLLGAGVHPEDAYEYSGIFSDPSAAYLKSEKYAEEQAKLEHERAMQAIADQQAAVAAGTAVGVGGDTTHNTTETVIGVRGGSSGGDEVSE